jgi:prolipoprotein diacylglyceryltransferase
VRWIGFCLRVNAYWSQIVNPQSVCPRLGASLFLIEEDYICSNAGSIPNSWRQAQQSVHPTFLQEIIFEILVAIDLLMIYKCGIRIDRSNLGSRK